MTAALAKLPEPRPTVIVSGAEPKAGSLAALLAGSPANFDTAPTHPDEPCFWLYSSGSTGRPKGTVHIHSSLVQTAELYAVPVLGIAESDVTFSAAKLFFAYGLGNGLTFPMAVGATSVLTAERPTPSVVSRILCERRPTIFYGVPTLYNAMLASNELPGREELALRCCVSAGEPLPQEIGRRGSASTSSTASARRKCSTSFSATGRTSCATAPPASRSPATRSRSSTRRAGRSGAAKSATCWSAARPVPPSTGTTASAAGRPSTAHGRAPGTSISRIRTAITSIAAAATTC